MPPPRARTWGRRGQTSVVRVRGRSWHHWSIAAMCCYKQGETSRLIYRPRRHRKHKGKGCDSFSWRDYRDLAVGAHLQLKAPIVLVWENLNTRLAAGMRQYADEHDWLTIVQLLSYAPDLNPVEGVWSLLRRGPLANTAFTDDDHLKRTLRRGLRHIQLRPDLINGCLAGTGLSLTHHPTTIPTFGPHEGAQKRTQSGRPRTPGQQTPHHHRQPGHPARGVADRRRPGTAEGVGGVPRPVGRPEGRWSHAGVQGVRTSRGRIHRADLREFRRAGRARQGLLVGSAEPGSRSARALAYLASMAAPRR